MLHMPHNHDEWIVATVSALAGFFFGGAAVAAAQTFLKRAFNIG